MCYNICYHNSQLSAERISIMVRHIWHSALSPPRNKSRTIRAMTAHRKRVWIKGVPLRIRPSFQPKPSSACLFCELVHAPGGPGQCTDPLTLDTRSLHQTIVCQKNAAKANCSKDPCRLCGQPKRNTAQTKHHLPLPLPLPPFFPPAREGPA